EWIGHCRQRGDIARRCVEYSYVIERDELICRASRLRIGQLAVELHRLQTERATCCSRVTGETVGLARKNPGLALADGTSCAAAYERGIALRGIPLVGIAAPAAVGMAHQQARLDQAFTETKALHDDRSDWQLPMTIRLDRDTAAVRQCEPAFLSGAVGPERCIDRIRDQPGGGLSRQLRIDTTRFAEPCRNRS